MSGSAAHKPSILWVNLRLLHPLIGGDRTRTYQMLRQLKQHCHIRYLSPLTAEDTQDAVDRSSEYCHELVTFPHQPPTTDSWRYYAGALRRALLGGQPISSLRHGNSTATRTLQHLMTQAETPDIVVADYLMSFVHFETIDLSQAPPVVVFQHNLESLIWERHAAATRNPLKVWLYQRERTLTRRLEESVARRAAGQIAVSPDEETVFREERGMRNVLGWVPTGVDCEYFRPPPQEGDPQTLIFLGSMDWHANIDAILWFVAACFPQLKRQAPGTRLLLIGRNPTAAIRNLAEQDPSIEVTGTVADVRPWLARGAIMILPLRIGGGTRIKVYEALAAGLALVSTPVGVEGLPIRPDEHALLTETPEAMTAALLHLMRDAEARHLLQTTARAWVEREFSWASASARFLELCDQVKRTPNAQK